MKLAIPLSAVAAALAIHTLWGGNPVAVKFGLLVFPPMWSAFIRFVIAVVCIALWARLSGVPLWPRRNEWRPLLILGLLFTVQIGAMNIGFDQTSGSMAAVLISTNPLFAAVFAHFLIAGDRLTPLKSAGLVVAFTGVAAVLMRGTAVSDVAVATRGNAVVLLSAFLLGLRLVLSARLLQRVDTSRVALWQMLISLPLFGLAALGWETVAWDNFGWKPAAGLAYQGIVVAGLGFMVSFHLMKRYTPSVMVSFNFVSPIAGVLLAMWLLQEAITPRLIAGMMLVAAGLILIARR